MAPQGLLGVYDWNGNQYLCNLQIHSFAIGTNLRREHFRNSGKRNAINSIPQYVVAWVG